MRVNLLILFICGLLLTACGGGGGSSGGGASATPIAVSGVTPASLTFSNQITSTTSAAQLVTLSNTGNAVLSISGISLSGTNASSFTQTNTCGATLAPASNCTLSVTFSPTAAGNYSASLIISANVSVPTVSLAGTGVNTYAVGGSLTGLLNNGSITLTNGADTLTITNNGNFQFKNAIVQGSSYSVAIANQPSGQTCTISNASGTIFANVTNVNVVCAINTYSISGTLTGSPIAFPIVLTDNATDNLTVNGTGNFTFGTAVSYSNPYAVTVKSTPTGETCSVSNGSGTVSGNVTNVGVACVLPVGVISPATLTFGSQNVGTSSASQPVTLTNTGTSALFISGLSFGGTNANSFTQTNTCGPSITPGGNCTIAVTFAPKVGGSLSASLNIAANVAVPTVALAGTGQAVYSVGGTVSGLPSGGSVTLLNNNGNSTTITSNGNFTFSTQLASGSSYAVTVSSSPNNYQCITQNGSGTLNSNITNVLINCAVTPVFASAPILLPDLRSKYNQLCGDNTELRLSTANMSHHTDNKRDIIAVMWCMVNPVGQVLQNTVPTPNGLVVFRQRSDGTFYDATSEIFGVEMVDIGGALGEEHMAVYDENHDGYDDIVLSPTGEDGRSLSPSDPSTWNNKQAVFLTSLGDGRYKVEKLGTPSYGSRDDLVDNALGSEDVITSVIGYGGKNEAWRFTNGGWSITTDYDSLGNNLSGLFFPRTSPGVGTQSHIAATSATSLQLYGLSPSGWVQQGTWSLTQKATASYVSWNGDTGNLAISTINGHDYGFLAFNRPCSFQFSPNSEVLAIYAVPASEITGGYNGQLLHESTSDFQTHNLILGFSIAGGQITPVNLGLKNEIVNLMGLRFDCFDVNNDGYQDLVISNWGNNSQPLVYLNGHDNTLSSVKLNSFPVGSPNFNGNTSIIVDIDGDGIPDLLVYPLNGLINNPSTVQFEIYKGKRFLDVVDVN